MYISYDGMTDPLGQSQVLPYLAELSKSGFEFTILSFEKKNRFKKEKSIVKAIIDAAKIKWIPLWFSSNPPFISKIYDRWKLKRTAYKVYRQEKFDLIHCRSYVAAETGLQLKKIFNTKYLFDMRGFWADEKAENGQWNQKNFFYRAVYKHYKAKEKEFLLSADGIITLTQSAKDYLLAMPEYKQLSIDVIPCCTDLDHFDYNKILPVEIAEMRNKLKIPDNARIVSYLGSVGGWYMIHEMLFLFKMLTERYPDYVLLVLTKDNIDKVKNEAKKIGIRDEQIFITYSIRKELPKYLALSIFSIFFIRNTFSKIASSPTKHAELMGMGIPVICNAVGDTGNIVNSTHTGFVINDFSEDTIKDTLRQLYNLERIDKAYIRNCAKEIFDLKMGAMKYLSVYKTILLSD